MAGNWVFQKLQLTGMLGDLPANIEISAAIHSGESEAEGYGAKKPMCNCIKDERN